MDPHTHFLFPFAIGVILTKLNIFDWRLAFLCGFIGLFIDIDHYIEHIIYAKKNRFSLIDTWNNSMKYHRFAQRSFIHYRVGAVISTLVFVIVAYFHGRLALAIAIGYYSHLLLDFGISIRKNKSLRWKFGKLFMREGYVELILDAISVIIIVVLFII